MATGTVTKVIPTSGTGYCKMPDGTLIQWGKLSLGSKSTAAIGSLYGAGYSDPQHFLVAFPFEFYSTDTTSFFISPIGGTYEIITAIAANYQGIQQIDVARPTSGSISGNFSWLAVGRWKA